MRGKVAVAAVVIAAICCVLLLLASAGQECRKEYRDVYEQMQMERLITGNI